MVDPKRHINVLSPEEQAFLEECEGAFANRFTDLDDEFMAHCQRPSKPPPVVHPWNSRRGGGGGWRGGDRRFHDRGGRGGGRGHYRGRDDYKPYNRNNYQSGRGDHYRMGRERDAAPRSDYTPYSRSGDRPHEQEPRR
uniref:RNMT-activating mini protein n=1 Tax=Anopheles dirus TaxID=7168 RepID=A0A182NCX6_9DIPT